MRGGLGNHLTVNVECNACGYKFNLSPGQYTIDMGNRGFGGYSEFGSESVGTWPHGCIICGDNPHDGPAKKARIEAARTARESTSEEPSTPAG